MKRAALRQDETGLKRPRRNTRGRIKERKGGWEGWWWWWGGHSKGKETSVGIWESVHTFSSVGTSCLPGPGPPGVLKNPPPPPPTPVEVLSRWRPDLPRCQRGRPVGQSPNLYAETPSQFTPRKKGATRRHDRSVVVTCARPSNGNARLQKS